MKDKKNAVANPSKRMDLGYILAAVIFLFNPTINIVDILPDIFGILFLLKGLQKWADLCPNIADAMAGFSRYRWFMLLKLFCVVLVPLSVEDTDVLLLTFAFAVVELIYVLPNVRRIFDGLEYFGTRFNGRSVLHNMKNVRTLTTVLIVGRAMLTLLPELCSLSSFDNLGYVTSGVQIDYADYKNLFVGFNLILSTLMGVLWLVNVIPYVKRISAETDFLERVLHDYDLEITNNVGLAVRRTMRSAITLIVAGFAFFPNFWIDGFNVIPTFIGAIILIFAARRILQLTGGSRRVVIAQTIFAVVSVLSYAASLLFAEFYGLESITRDFTAYDIYNLTRILGIVEYAAMAVSVYTIFGELRALIGKHLSPDPDVSDRRLTDVYISHRRETEKTMLAGFIGFIIVLAANSIFMFMRAEIDAGYWLVPFIATGIWFIYMISSLNQLYDQIEYKYI